MNSIHSPKVQSAYDRLRNSGCKIIIVDLIPTLDAQVLWKKIES